MRRTTSVSARSSLVILMTGSVLVAALTGPPSIAAPNAGKRAHAAASAPSPALASPPSPAALTDTHRVTLLTGDRVTVARDDSGHVLASLTPRSPHYRKPVRMVAVAGHTYVMPKLRTPLVRRLDPSVFDVAALDTPTGRVSLDVTFGDGTAPHSIPGMQVHPSTARPARGGRTIARASYDASGPRSRSLASLRGVSRIAVSGATPAAAPDYELHTLTIDATTVEGTPVPAQYVLVFNADDGEFSHLGVIVDGEWKVSVPSGHYMIVSGDFRRVVVDQATVDDTDTSTSFSMAEATVRPKLDYPGHSKLYPELEINGVSDAGPLNGSVFGWGFIGVLPRVSPVAGVVAGHLSTEVRQTWGPKGYVPYTYPHGGGVAPHPIKRMAVGLKALDGIPADLSFHYSDADFARVDVRHYATGASQVSEDSTFGTTPQTLLVGLFSLPTSRPAVVHVMVEGSNDIVWHTLASAAAPLFSKRTYMEGRAVYHRGERASVPFFRGPITPVADRGGESGRVCSLCVVDGTLQGHLSMLSTAGTRQLGNNEDAKWAVFHGTKRLGHGDTAIAPQIKNVKQGERFRLVANTGVPDRTFVLSSHVRDEWRFHTPKVRHVVPILRADYVPPTNLRSRGKRGRVAFPITFDNLGPIDARVKDAAVKWSVNGTTWHAASVKRKDANTFRVGYTNPAATKVHRYLSLRVFGKDTAGRSIAEEVEHAYLLPKATVHSGQTTAGTTLHRSAFDPDRLCRTAGKQRYSCFVELQSVARDTGDTRDIRKASTAPRGWGAQGLRSAYALGPDQSPSTVAVVVAYHYPHAEADMNHYRQQFGLPLCTTASGCFAKLNQDGQTGNYPEKDFGWGVEAALDLQMVSAACPTCRIVLVEADSPLDQALETAEQTAVDAGATVTNHSYGRIDFTGTEAHAAAYDHPGVTAVAASGDFGYEPPSFPASSPEVVAVGGTTLARSSTDPRGWTERVWDRAGSGCSAYFGKPAAQPDVACHGRTVADVSAVSYGLAVYDTSLPKAFRGWLGVAGTSASSPLVAGMIASGGHGGLRPTDLYTVPGGFNDVVGGSNGLCRGSYMCTGVVGYDAPTGLGTPNGAEAFQ